MEGTHSQEIKDTSTSGIYLWSKGLIREVWLLYTIQTNILLQIISLNPSKDIFSAGFLKSSWDGNIFMLLEMLLMNKSRSVLDIILNQKSSRQSRKNKKITTYVDVLKGSNVSMATKSDVFWFKSMYLFGHFFNNIDQNPCISSIILLINTINKLGSIMCNIFSFIS